MSLFGRTLRATQKRFFQKHFFGICSVKAKPRFSFWVFGGKKGNGNRTRLLKRVARARNKGYNSLRRNFMAEIPRKWLTLGLRRKSPLDIFRNEIYSQDRYAQ